MMTSKANDNDPRVSDAYRELATEKSPPELDATILKMAAGDVRTRYGLARGWLRPVAWAATIGLSLAFVLEISQYTDVPATPELAAERLEAAKSKDEDLANQELHKRSDAPAPAKALAPRIEGASPAAMESAALIQDFETDNASVLQEAEAQMRMDTGEARSAASFAEKKEWTGHCDAVARASAESWYECIERLRDERLTDAARQELDALLVEFPDFREPAPDR
jgi:hypothetical protein